MPKDTHKKHTPTPWFSDFFGNITTHPPRRGLRQLLPTTGIIAKVNKNPKYNAEFIVCAVNNHDALIAALQLVLDRDDIADCELGQMIRDLINKVEREKDVT